MFLEFLAKHQISDKVIAVSVSGGADSLALTLMTDDELRPLGYHLVALTVDHGLRPSSAQEARDVARLMKARGIEHHILVWRGQKPQTGIEEAARLARYALLTEWCQKHKIGAIFLAHHLYDQTETFLMRLQRGSGLDGLCAMAECTAWPKIKLLRPLLNTPPQLMKEYLTARQIPWAEDESNTDERLLRVKARHILPVLEKLGISAEKIGQTCARLQSAQQYLNAETERFLKLYFDVFENFAYACLFADFVTFAPEMQFRLLVRILSDVGGTCYPPRAESVLKLLARFQESSFKSATLSHCKLTLCDGKLWFLPERASVLGASQPAWKNFVKTNRSFQDKHLPAAMRAFYVHGNKTDSNR